MKSDPAAARPQSELIEAGNSPSDRGSWWDRLGFVVVQALFFLALASTLRAVLWERFGPEAAQTGRVIARVFAVGFHFDLVVASALFAPLALWMSLVPARWLAARWHRFTLWGACAAGWFLICFVHVAEFYFFKEYLSRFNTVAIDYLHYWTEVSGNISESYPVGDIVALCALGTAVVVFLSWHFATPRPGRGLVRRGAAGLGWIAAGTGLAFTLSLAEVRFSTERLVNEIAANGLVSGLTALLTRDLEYAVFYPTTDRDSAWAKARAAIATPDTQLVGRPDSLVRHVAGDAVRPRLNVCVMLEESFGSEFWGILNDRKLDKSLTPRLDQLARSDGWLFDRIYADGNRTIRGIEAVLASFPPLPGDSIVARTRTHGMDTLATVLGRDGYSSTFIYPGRGFFDDLRNFAMHNGYERFIEQKDFVAPVFTNTWGVSNEDLYDRALAEMRAMHASGQPFLITTLSVSNHQPFTYPEGRIPEPPKQRSRKNAVKYCDYALGRFFDAVKREEFWKDTIFVIVADHGARVYGSQTIPIRSYEIPLLFVGPAVIEKPRLDNTLGCQLDIAPTVLGLIGRPYDTTFFGHDLRHVPPHQQRVLLTHNREIGIYRDERLVTFGLNKTITAFAGDVKTANLKPLPHLDETARALADEATAIFQTADELYNTQRYQAR